MNLHNRLVSREMETEARVVIYRIRVGLGLGLFLSLSSHKQHRYEASLILSSPRCYSLRKSFDWVLG
jgi:hypothetical protein